MRHRRHLVAIAALLLAFFATGCSDRLAADTADNEPAVVEAIEGSDLARVVLTERAAERLGIETTEVQLNTARLAVPSSALWIDPKGSFWVYTNPEPLVYLRHQVVVEDDDGKTALLSEGPPEGTRVVSVGVSELYGTEVGVGK